MYMRFEKLSSKPAPPTFPDHPLIPTEPSVFDDSELAHRACVECRFFVDKFVCTNEKLKSWDAVTGWRHSAPWKLRLVPTGEEGVGKCGPEGKGWEPREPKRSDGLWLWLLFGAFTLAAIVLTLWPR